MTLQVKDLEVGKSYRILDLGDADLGGCEFNTSLPFTVYKIDADGNVQLDNVSFRGGLGIWYVFSAEETTTFELVE